MPGNTTVWTGACARSATGLLIKEWVWEGRGMVQERNGTGAVTKTFFAQGFVAGLAGYYYTRDHLGSIRELVDANGAVRARYDYDPWGQREKLSGDVDADFGFTGHYWHPETGLYFTAYRAYDPALGRWLNRDPLENAEISQGPNLYAYVGNNPVNAVDPLGLTYINLNLQLGFAFLGRAGVSVGWIFDHRGAHFYATSGVVSSPGVSVTCAPAEDAVATPGPINSASAAAVVALGAGSDAHGNAWTFEYGLGVKGVSLTQGRQWDTWYPTK